MVEVTSPPPAWGNDKLSEFIETARHNTFATFHNLKPQYNLLKDVNQLYWDIVDNLLNTRDWFPAFFLLRSHSSYLGAVRLCLSGQIPEAFLILRSCLENALYGLYISRNPQSAEIWLSRHDNEESYKKCRNEFISAKVLQCLELNDPRTHSVAEALYHRTIDYGAHPNEKALFSAFRQTKEKDGVRFDVLYLTGHTLALHLCLKSCAQVGICSLDVFRNIFKERFDILGISEKLLVIKQRTDRISIPKPIPPNKD